MRTICVDGATGTIGRAVVVELVKRGFGVVCLVRGPVDDHLAGATVRMIDVADRKAVARDGFAGERFDVVMSCMTSRTGVPADAWAVDYRAQMNVLKAAQATKAGDAMFDRLADGIFQIPVGPDRSGAQRPAITPREQGETEKRPEH